MNGEYKDASEIVKDAILIDEQYKNRIIEELQIVIAKGWDGAISKRSVKDIITSNGTTK